MSESEAKTQDNASMEIFVSMPIWKAVFKNSLPAMVAILFNLVYNLADTFFIGLTHDDYAVAAISLGTPLFMLLTAVGTIFGVGGVSVISRSLGKGDHDYAKKTCSFCMWAGLAGGLILTIIYLVFTNPILRLLGASDNTWSYAQIYVRIIAFAGPFAVVPSTFSNIIRCEGKSMTATIGMLGGNLLNIILDPIFILGFGMGTAGAGLATTLSMVAASCYYFIYFARGKSMLSASPKDFSARNKICSSVLVIGLPSCLGTLMVSVATIIMNSQMAKYDDLAVAGVGVATKITMFATMLAGGIGQGVQSLIGYCVGAKLWKRLRSFMYFSLAFAFIFCGLVSALCYGFARPIVDAFLTEPDALDFGVTFTRHLLITGALVGIFYLSANTIQAMGAAVATLILNLSRQGFLYIPLMFIMQYAMKSANGAMGAVNGIVWAQPVADVIAFVLAVVLLIFTYRSLMKKAEKEGMNTPAPTPEESA